jgi:hypothetical protein
VRPGRPSAPGTAQGRTVRVLIVAELHRPPRATAPPGAPIVGEQLGPQGAQGRVDDAGSLLPRQHPLGFGHDVAPSKFCWPLLLFDDIREQGGGHLS